MDALIKYLPLYTMGWPCERVTRIQEYGWSGYSETLRSAGRRFYALDANQTLEFESYDSQLTLEEFQSSPLSKIQNHTLLHLVISSLYRQKIPGVHVNDCNTVPTLNAMLHVVQAAGQAYDYVFMRKADQPYKDLYNQSSQKILWHGLHTRITGGMSPVNRPKMFEIIVFNQYSQYEILSHGQPIDRTKVIPLAELVTHLTEAFDWQSLTCGMLSFLIPILLASLFYAFTFESPESHCCTRITQKVDTLVNCFTYRLCTLIAFICGDCDAHFSTFFQPIVRWSRRSVTRYSLCLVAITSLMLSLMYTTCFSVHLLSNLIDKPVEYLNTLSDVFHFFADHNLKNLTFASAGLSFRRRQDLLKYPLNERDDNATYVSMMSSEKIYNKTVDYYLTIREKDVIANTENYGCQQVKLSDPLWHVKKFHCYTGYIVPGYESFLINKRTTSESQFKFLRRVARGMVEGHLARRTNRHDSDMYHTASMRADLFESHESTTLDVIKLTSMKGIFLDTLTLHGIIIVATLICRLLFKVIKKIVYTSSLHVLQFSQPFYLAVKWYITQCLSDNKVHPM